MVYIVDVTVTDPAARQVRNYKVPGDAANQAEIRRISEYDDWNLVGSRNVVFFPFAVETFGAIGDQAFKLLSDSLGKRFNLPGVATTQLLQEVSVGMHATRASIFSKVKEHLTTNEPVARDPSDRPSQIPLPVPDRWFVRGSSRYANFQHLIARARAPRSPLTRN
jgi:hypothetical protein